MKRIFSVPVVGASGVNLLDKNGKEQLMSELVEVSLFNLSELNGSVVSPETKLRAWEIIQKFWDAAPGQPVELNTDELKLIDDVMAKAFTAGVYGQVKMIIEND